MLVEIILNPALLGNHLFSIFNKFAKKCRWSAYHPAIREPLTLIWS
jgi:hypothetical protein